MSEPQEKKKTEYVYDRQTKAAMITINNPETYNMSHDEIIHIMHTKFKHLVYWCMCDEQGSCYHTHVYFLLSKKRRHSVLRKLFPHAHIEEAKGSPQQCRDYLLKEGDKFKDKAETKIEGTFYEEGEIPKVIISNDRAQMLQQIEEQLDQGMRPEEIMSQSIVLRQYESLIRKHFFARRFKETPPIRDVKVTWHLGASGSGKSYTYVKLCRQYTPEEVYYASVFTHACAGLVETYSGERILFLDEVKTDSFRYGYLLQLLQGYRTPIYARYSNVYSLWSEIHITSIFTPHDIYENMVDVSNRSIDSEYQLLRRITNYVYHWKTEDGEYHEYEIPASQYTNYQDLIYMATHDGFRPVSDENNPFTESEVQADAETKIKD